MHISTCIYQHSQCESLNACMQERTYKISSKVYNRGTYTLHSPRHNAFSFLSIIHAIKYFLICMHTTNNACIYVCIIEGINNTPHQISARNLPQSSSATQTQNKQEKQILTHTSNYQNSNRNNRTKYVIHINSSIKLETIPPFVQYTFTKHSNEDSQILQKQTQKKHQSNFSMSLCYKVIQLQQNLILLVILIIRVIVLKEMFYFTRSYILYQKRTKKSQITTSSEKKRSYVRKKKVAQKSSTFNQILGV
eukprot:TRINITY_DN17903_c0_g1_i11.p2 TRINITY_DN17903_c0_g1~~TRINITY_DN17903_c0_g1_i11.p2  ORF type:complete len:250 (+),score=-20.85 TRINITY_DN17903_c0_g1_i11:1264-2013(+)